MERQGIQFKVSSTRVFLARVRAQSSLVEKVKLTQKSNERLSELMKEVREGKRSKFSLDEEGVL